MVFYDFKAENANGSREMIQIYFQIFHKSGVFCGVLNETS